MAAGKKDDKKAGAAPEGDALEAKQKKKKLFMMIGLAVLLVVISVGATIGALKFLSPQPKSAEVASEDSSSEHAAAGSEAIYYALKPNFTVNFDVNGRQRFLQTELTFMYRDQKLLKILELHMPELRNSLVLLLSSQVFDELQTLEGKEKLRAAALEEVQDIIYKEQKAALAKMSAKEREKEKSNGEPANVEQVLFTQFVMQ